MNYIVDSQVHFNNIHNTSNEDFFNYVRYVRDFTIPKQDINNIIEQIQIRCNSLGYRFEFGCCGVNTLHRINKHER